MDPKKPAQQSVRDEKVVTEQDVLKVQEFVKKLGGVDKAKLALDELARLRKSA
jgi:hypothetical protein